MRICAFVLVVVGVMACASFGWSTKEHILLTRLAAEGLIADPKTPEAMKQWLRKAAPDLRDAAGDKQFLLDARLGSYPRGADGLSLWAVVPDLIAAADGTGENARKIEPFGVPERLLHFVDMEYFYPDDAKRSYADDLSHKPAISDFPRDMTDPRWARAGMLPFRVENCYQNLVKEIRKGRLVDTPGQMPRDEHATKWAGMLAHYAEDNTQPQHATADYKSQSYFPDKLRAPNVHGDVEFKLVDDEFEDYRALREEFWQELTKALGEVRDPVTTDDPWAATLEVSSASYDALPLIGHAALAAYKRGDGPSGWKFDADVFFHFKGTVRGQETTVLQLKAHQEAWAVKRVQRLWCKAWAETHARPAGDEKSAAGR
ncbi:MAG: hypothetical protein JWL69_832 [Phycisphaerales bacterium]|nr:hypothetical protein [Phycisphaerales bacterium]MDB5358217.1 hypothetical protein [Phycisphaerales bacterium]